jgi:hypothetical protein
MSILPELTELLKKPFDIKALLEKVESILEAGQPKNGNPEREYYGNIK